MSRTLLETAEIATNQIERPRDKASRLIELSRAYAQFNEQEKAIELFDQALFVILEIPDENLRLFELYSYGLSLASIVPIDDLEASIDRIFAFAEGQLTTEEVQQVKISAIAASYGYAGEYDRAIELSNEIEAPQIQRLTQELIRQTALRETGDTAWIRGSSDRNPFSEEIAVPSPSARLVELSFDVFRQQNDPLFDFEANVAERLEIISDLPHPAERARAYTDISRHLAERGQAERTLEYLNLASQALTQVANDEANGHAYYPWGWSPEQELISIGRILIRAGYLERGLVQIRSIENEQAFVPEKMLALIYAAEQITSSSEVSSDSIALANELLSESEALAEFIPVDSEGIDDLLTIAIEYHARGFSDYARSLSQRLQTLYENGTVSEVVEDRYDVLFRWAPLLTELGEFELATQVALDNGDTEQLERIPAALVIANQEAQARELLEKISPLSARAYAIANMALAYESLSRSDVAFTMMAQALDISQVDDLSRESPDNSHLSQTGVNNFLPLTENLMRWYIDAAGVAPAKQLLSQIENDDNRISLLIQLFPAEDVLQELYVSDSIDLDDRTLFALSMRALSEEDFNSAIVATAAMEDSPHWQADTLIKAVTQYADTSPSIGPETEALIQAIANRYR